MPQHWRPSVERALATGETPRAILETDLSGPEIARQLVVSLSTLRTHTQNIYSKLSVNNRREAIHRAEELGLL